jgi:uncharacterized protein (TIGR00251 family)
MSATRAVRSHPHGALLTVWAVPGAKRTEIMGLHGDALRIRIAAPPERGRANRELIKHLSDRLGVEVRLAGGAGSRRKRILAPGVSVSRLVEIVDDLVN